MGIRCSHEDAEIAAYEVLRDVRVALLRRGVAHDTALAWGRREFGVANIFTCSVREFMDARPPAPTREEEDD